MEIKYYSTNHNQPNGFKDKISFEKALLTGMAPDKGLFMPAKIPKFEKQEILELKDKPYDYIAFKVLQKFLNDDIPEEQLKKITGESYNFEVLIEKIDENKYLVRLDRGPTASFKDFAARFMAGAMNYFKDAGQKLTILVATSGDTGSAVGEAFRGLEGIKVFILYPKEEVSSIQKKQLDSIGENVTSIEIDGKFDDCQKLVKKAFTDPDLKPLNLTSANSINIGRILPQIVYYYYSYSKIAKDFEQVIFSVPSGNFGNSLGCEIARRMGLPVKKLVLAVNENDEFPKFLETSIYEKVDPSKNCLSNAMNVGNPSNLARYFELYGGNLDKDGNVHKIPDIDIMKKNLFSVSISDEETIKTIIQTHNKYKILVEPHGAVGIAALKKYLQLRKEEENIKSIILETADPSKFPEIIERELNITPKTPETINKIYKRKRFSKELPNDYRSFKVFLLKNANN